MLKSILIKNYALIDHIEIFFTKEFSTVTGETGAGKSIILGALSLIMGQRFDTDLLKNKENKCIVEGHFKISDQLKNLFSAHDVDFEKESVFRREILPNGKSRAFINDTPVNLNSLKEIAEKLIDIHSQHQSLNLKDKLYQLHIVDSMAENQLLRSQYFALLTDYRKANKELIDFKAQSAKSLTDLDYYQFQFEQLKNANLHNGEQEELENELNEQTHAEDIKTALFNACEIINSNDINCINQLKEIRSGFEKIKNNYRTSIEYINRIDSVLIELKDIADDCEKKCNLVEYDSSRIQEITDKLNLIYELEKKHNMNSISDLIELQNQLKTRIESIESFDQKIEELNGVIKKIGFQLDDRAVKISDSRKKVSGKIEKELVAYLNQLGIPYAVIKIDIQPLAEFSDSGKDEVSILFSANNKVEPAEISKIASGGELSRLMLSIKALLSVINDLPSLIFDEIDMGVSGDIAHKMGNIMFDISKRNQVIAITHLPQVACKGNNHYLVYKEFNLTGTETKIKLLKKEDRIQEIAKMLSGNEITSAAIENAKELLEY